MAPLFPRRCSLSWRVIQRRPSSSSAQDPRIADLGHAIEDDFATIKQEYQTPRHPIALAHGLFGFDELRLTGNFLPGVHYWRGITEALKATGVEVISTTVPPSASIEDRAHVLQECLEQKAPGRELSIIAHSMGGLDARYMLSRLRPTNFTVKSLTTIATPHRGSAFADYVLDGIGASSLPKLYKALNAMQIQTEAFKQLTTRHMIETFNPETPDAAHVQYYSYGASITPAVWSIFRQSHRIISKVEGGNDGLVSVQSSRWGDYRGTLVSVSHLDLINWTNRLRWLAWEMAGNERKFNAIAFYLHIADMLAKQGF